MNLLEWTDGDLHVDEISAAQAFDLLARTNFEKNRLADRAHIDDLADMMASGQWVGRTLLTIAVNGDGIPYLVDGQHRLRAFQEAVLRGRTEPLPVVLQRITDHAPREAYALLDSAMKKRSPGVIGVALEIPIRNPGLLKQALSAGRWAMRYAGIVEERTVRVWDVAHGVDAEPQEFELTGRVSYRGAAREYVQDRIQQFSTLSKLLDDTTKRDTRIVSVMRGARVVPILVETLAADPDRASRMWRGVLQGVDADLVATVLRERLLEKAPAGTARGFSEKSRFVAAAWNSLINRGPDTEPRLVRSASPTDVTLAECTYRDRQIRVIA